MAKSTSRCLGINLKASIFPNFPGACHQTPIFNANFFSPPPNLKILYEPLDIDGLTVSTGGPFTPRN